MKLEYKIVRLAGPDATIVNELNKLAAEGWRVVENIDQSNQDHFVFLMELRTE